jgi:hypothetical protein
VEGKEVTIHDHFEGSSRCVECAGDCRLTGDDLAVTVLVRYIFESATWTRRHLGGLEVSGLEGVGVDVRRFERRAQETNR